MAKTLAELLAELARYWGRLNGPIIPIGSTYAQCLGITGFVALLEGFCSENQLTESEVSMLQGGMNFPEVTYE
jgi:hypothetical protein